MTSQNQPAGRRPSKLVVALQNMATRIHTVLYRTRNGVIGGRIANSPVLLLITTGRRPRAFRGTHQFRFWSGRGNVLADPLNEGSPWRPSTPSKRRGDDASFPTIDQRCAT